MHVTVTRSAESVAPRRGGRNVSLDTLRAAAIILVVFCHCSSSYGLPNAIDFLGLGGVGVDLFFCLSGWLLGKQLCEEFQKTGDIQIRRFWLRRWLRTLPAYYAVLGATVLQSWLQGKTPGWSQYVVFLQNYRGMPFFGVSWSLCVEEYFYLAVAPLLLLLCRRRRMLAFAIPLLLVPLASRLSIEWVAQNWGWQWDIQMTHLRYDQCAAGVVLAAAATFAPRAWSLLCRSMLLLVPLAITLAGMNLAWRLTHAPRNDWDPLVWTFIFGTLVVVANSSDFWRTRAHVPGARYIADRAYAIYLVHVEAIAVVRRVAGAEDGYVNIPMAMYVIAVWLVSLLIAEVLYRGIERPVMRAREGFAATRSTHPVPASSAAVA
jgi:peptidoglycan/LPS O-acetylase OafA/YrhL